ncbi:Reverse transcriptase (RNA-dependent DNA polymerase) [Popillia japonica]|uniref:Reverse transcriptase (RNA-dependent DNA polymerase) n=1 Tax=Popillia japonica TaxID=7064 RepID=A0AAW1KR03_POPJA
MVADQFGTSTLHPVAVCPAPCSSFTFGLVCAEDIIAVVNKIPNKTSYGDDGISSHLLKQIIGHIAEYLAFMVNMSFSTGKFPTPWKTAVVVPVHKRSNLSNAYQQVCLTEESQKLVTISTHKGLFSYTRLPYGITSAPAIFQNLIEQIFVDIPGVQCFLDDLLVTGRNDAEHVKHLEEVFKRLKDCGLKVQKSKCSFFKDSVEYLGHVISKDGLHTCEDKID